MFFRHQPGRNFPYKCIYHFKEQHFVKIHVKSGLTHTVTHTAKCPKSGGEDNCVILSAVLYFFAIFSHHLCHEIAHLFGGAFLHLPRDVGVGSQRETCVEMTEHTGYCFHVHAVL